MPPKPRGKRTAAPPPAPPPAPAAAPSKLDKLKTAFDTAKQGVISAVESEQGQAAIDFTKSVKKSAIDDPIDTRYISKQAKEEVDKAYKRYKEKASGIILSEVDKIYNDLKKKNKMLQKEEVDRSKNINVGRESYLMKDIIVGEFMERIDLLMALIETIQIKNLMTTGYTKQIKQKVKVMYDDVSKIYIFDGDNDLLRPEDKISINAIKTFIKEYEIDKVTYDIRFGIQSNLFSEVRSSTMRRDTYTNEVVINIRNITMLLNQAIEGFLPSKSWGDRYKMFKQKDGGYYGRGWAFEEIGVDLTDETIDDDLIDNLKYKSIIDKLLPFIEADVTDNRLLDTIQSKYSEKGSTLNTNADLSDIESQIPFDILPKSTGYYILKEINQLIMDGDDNIFDVDDRNNEYEIDYTNIRNLNKPFKLKLERLETIEQLTEYSKKLKDRIGNMSNLTLNNYLDTYLQRASQLLTTSPGVIKVIDLVYLANLYIQAEKEDKNAIFKIPLPPRALEGGN